MLSLIAAFLLVCLLGLAVLATMVVENWGRLSVDLDPRPVAPEDVGTTTADVQSADVTFAERGPTGSDAAVDRDVELVLPGRSATDRAVAVLFAAYAAERMPEANRVAAWVTASDWPPSRSGGSYRPGADLRGRPVAVGKLLDCDDDDRCWLSLSDGTDIARGVRARPPRCEVLRGLLVTWEATRAAMSRVAPDQVRLAAASVEELSSRWSRTTGAADVAPLAEALSAAAEGGHGVIVRVPLEVIGPEPGARPAAAAAAPSVGCAR